MRTLLLLALLAPLPALAGPWPRARGEAFVFAGHVTGADGWTGLYAEYGLPRDLTLGVVAGGRPTNGTRAGEARARVFLRVPVLTGEAKPAWLAPWRFALEASLGRDHDADGGTTRYGLGATVGRGFQSRFGDGWTTLDLRADHAPDAPLRIELQTVLGLKPHPRWTVELGLFATQEIDLTLPARPDLELTVAPTVQYSLGKWGDARLGLSLGDGRTGVTLGWARSF